MVAVQNVEIEINPCMGAPLSVVVAAIPSGFISCRRFLCKEKFVATGAQWGTTIMGFCLFVVLVCLHPLFPWISVWLIGVWGGAAVLSPSTGCVVSGFLVFSTCPTLFAMVGAEQRGRGGHRAATPLTSAVFRISVSTLYELFLFYA